MLGREHEILREMNAWSGLCSLSKAMLVAWEAVLQCGEDFSLFLIAHLLQSVVAKIHIIQLVCINYDYDVKVRNLIQSISIVCEI